MSPSFRTVLKSILPNNSFASSDNAETPLPTASPAPDKTLPVTDETAPSAFAVIFAVPTAKKIPSITATINVVAQTRNPCIIPSIPASFPATKPPAVMPATRMTAEPIPTAVPMPEAGCSDNGLSINNPILEFNMDSSTDIANTVMTPPNTLPQDTLPFSSAKLNFFIIVRFLINTIIDSS